VNQTATGPDRIAAQLAADLDAGFAALFESHQHVLFSTALRICGGWADAEDLTATAFLRAFRALSGYDRERIAALRTRPWLLTILLNVQLAAGPAHRRGPGRAWRGACTGSGPLARTMIVASFGQIAPVSGHDHETGPGGAWGG
jgi:hypothetical protein